VNKLPIHYPQAIDDELDMYKKSSVRYFMSCYFKKVFRGEIKWFFRHHRKSISLIVLLILIVITTSSQFPVSCFIMPAMMREEGKEVENTVEINKYELAPFEEFVEHVIQRESSGRFNVVSSYGMLGAFQFCPTTLKSIGINVSKNHFLNNPELQKDAFMLLLIENKKTYRKYIDRMINKEIDNVNGELTESGILMAFHLYPESAIIYFDSEGKILGKPDGNGIYVNEYVQEFNGYEIPFLE